MGKKDLEELKRMVEGTPAVKKKKEDEYVSKRAKEEERMMQIEEEVGNILKKFKVEKGPAHEEDKKYYYTPIKLKSTVKDLQKSNEGIIRTMGSFYQLMHPLHALTARIMNTSFGKELQTNLEGSGIEYSGQQYVALILTFSIFTAGIILPYLLFLCAILNFPVLVAFAGSFVSGAGSLIMGFFFPSSKAKSRAKDMEREMPFVARHIVTQIKAGIGLHHAFRSVAEGDYGVLSEEFMRLIDEMDKGTSTVDALIRMRNRTKSEGMRRSITQMIRGVRTGGNLSDVLESIASDVAYELRMKMKDFGEKLNLVGVLFMFISVVFPVMFGILTSIYPLLGGAMPAGMVYLFYFLMAPAMSSFTVLLIKMWQPTV